MTCFADINFSQRSVATHVSCGGIFNIHLTANLLRNFPVNFKKNLLRFDRIMVTSLWPAFSATLYAGRLNVKVMVVKIFIYQETRLYILLIPFRLAMYLYSYKFGRGSIGTRCIQKCPIVFTGRLKMQDMKIRDGQKCRTWKCETWICSTSLHGWKLRDMKMRDQFAGVENAGKVSKSVKKCLKVVVFVCRVIPSV